MSSHLTYHKLIAGAAFALLPIINLSQNVNASSVQFPDEYFYNCVMNAYYEAPTPVKYEEARGTAEIQLMADPSLDLRFMPLISFEEEPIELDVDQLALINSLSCDGYYDYGDGEAGQYVTDTTGIELLTNLEFVRLYGNNINSLDLSKNRKLEIADLPGNNITNLKLPEGRRLWGLKLNGNWLTSLDLSNNLGVEVLAIALVAVLTTKPQFRTQTRRTRLRLEA